ncbi:MAG: hypothetical protein QOH61_506 [Chloroflexota bacterium]|jgi:hypothetical protein|nr:hypothetical protein [Chloroflexota bacterium]
MARSAVLGALLLIIGCTSPAPTTPPDFPGISVSNGTDLDVALVVNGSAIATIAHSVTTTIESSRLPPLPWAVAVRASSGRLLGNMTVNVADVRTGGANSTGDAIRIDLSCGRLDVWVGPPLFGPAPGPGQPGDCRP